MAVAVAVVMQLVFALFAVVAPMEFLGGARVALVVEAVVGLV